MRIKQKYTDKEIGGTYKHWKDNILTKHVEENYIILSHPEIVDVFEIDVKTGNKKYIDTIDKYLAIQEYVSKSDIYSIKDTTAKFDEFYRMTKMPEGYLSSEISNTIDKLISPKIVNPVKEKFEMKKIEKIFISHSSEDIKIVGELIDLIEIIGVPSDKIFCSSFEGYGISLGENFLERLKNELDNNILVIFILSENFYNSVICLCEMGATWIKTNEHIPLLIPPFDYDKIKGVMPNIQGLKINESRKLNLLKEKLELEFKISPINNSKWEIKRDSILLRINSIIDGSKLVQEDNNDNWIQNLKFSELSNSIKMIILYAEKHNITSVSFQKITQNINPRYNEKFVMNLVEENPEILSRVKLKTGQFGVKINLKHIKTDN